LVTVSPACGGLGGGLSEIDTFALPFSQNEFIRISILLIPGFNRMDPKDKLTISPFKVITAWLSKPGLNSPTILAGSSML
jgi:hypothetical protein